MIPYKDFIAWYQKMLADKWGYIPNTAGTMWTQEKQDKTTNAMAQRYGQKWVGHMVADCSGTFVYVYKKYDLSIYHGSNRIARVYIEEVLPISERKPGMAAFKYYKPGEKGYDLPDQYKKGGSQYNGDLNDYYHIGVVDDDPNCILNSATTANGFIRSNVSNGWNACGYLKAVDYEGDHEPVVDSDILIVTSENGAPVNMRQSASVTASIVTRVPVGSEVNKLGENSNGWTYVQYKAKKGWMMSKFLVPKGYDPVPNPIPDPDGGDDTPSSETVPIQDCIVSLKEIRKRIEGDIEDLTGLVSYINDKIYYLENLVADD